MNKLGGFLAGLTFIATAVVFGTVGSARVEAAACSNVSSYGAVSLSVPELPKLDDQVLWVRMQAPVKDYQVLAEVNQTDCYSIEAQNQTAEQWSWQNHRVGGDPALISFPKSSGNIIKIIGLTDGVKVDRILLAEKDCVPEDFGNNCQKRVELLPANDDGTVALSPLSDDSLSGKVLLSNTPVRQADKLKKLEYVVNGRVIQSSATAQPFDTTLLENGKYTVYIKSILDDGAIMSESIVIEVENPQNFFTPVFRWIKLNWQTIKPATIIVAGIAVLLIAVKLITARIKSRRERSFHGF